MLRRLYIRNLGLIAEADIQWGEGLNVITGETGAGKSMILDSLALLSGRRTERLPGPNPDAPTLVEAEFTEPSLETAWYEQWQVEPAPTLILRRQFSPDGRSRVFANDTPVSSQALREAAPFLFNIHSQFDSQRLAENTFRLVLLDKLAGQADLAFQYRQTFERLRRLREEHEHKQAEYNRLAEQEDFLRFRLDEILKASPRPDEDKTLEEELNRLTHAESILEYCHQALTLLDADEQGLLPLAGRLTALLRRLGGLLHEGETLAGDAADIQDRLASLCRAVEHLRDRVEISPERLHEVTERLDTLNSLMKKNHVSDVADLLQKQAELETRLAGFHLNAEEIQRLEAEMRAEEQNLLHIGRRLSEGRIRAAELLTAEVKKHLNELALEKASFEVRLQPLEVPAPTGLEECTFLFSANPGLPSRPVQKAASGGELSRLMLALKAVEAEQKMAPSFILDEIDSGISGRVSGLTARFLRRLSHHTQLIAVTHLPQIAAAGTTHFVVEKQHRPDGSAISEVKVVQGERRREVLATMLSAGSPAAPALQAAEHLLAEFAE